MFDIWMIYEDIENSKVFNDNVSIHIKVFNCEVLSIWNKILMKLDKINFNLI